MTTKGRKIDAAMAKAFVAIEAETSQTADLVKLARQVSTEFLVAHDAVQITAPRSSRVCN